MWPFGKRKRREVEQDAEYQAFLAAQKKPARVLPRTPTPRPSWKWDAETRQAAREQIEPVNRAYQASAVSYGPVDDLGISCIPAAHLHDHYPDQAND